MSANRPLRRAALFAPVLAGALLFSLPLCAADTDFKPPLQRVLEQRCTGCHTLERVGIALDQGRDLDSILQAMQARGAVLNEQDRQVLGTFWGPSARTTAVQPLAAPITKEQASAFDRVIEQRCLLCHTRERIDDAIARRLPFEPIETIMRDRGAVLSPEERQVLRTFWGKPHR